MSKKEDIQKTRLELKNIILEQVKPTREKLDALLNEQAAILCPFEIGEELVLDNGKKGKITEITYHSLDYDFLETEDFDFIDKYDEMLSTYAYSLDDKNFSITWQCSGLRMIKNDTEVGKVTFNGISPDRFEVDVENKSVKIKRLKFLVDNEYFLSDFSDLKE